MYLYFSIYADKYYSLTRNIGIRLTGRQNTDIQSMITPVKIGVFVILSYLLNISILYCLWGKINIWMIIILGIILHFIPSILSLFITVPTQKSLLISMRDQLEKDVNNIVKPYYFDLIKFLNENITGYEDSANAIFIDQIEKEINIYGSEWNYVNHIVDNKDSVRIRMYLHFYMDDDFSDIPFTREYLEKLI
ncbi:hypothetical protein CMU94_02195 [Elizabethkingia anophelis]|nr:hypothetical protein [Elizabethkingia anophelis]